MILTFLPIRLYFRERRRLKDFTTDNEVYQLLHKAYADMENKPYPFEFKEWEAFNNAVLLCTLILHDDDIPSTNYNEYWNYTYSLYADNLYGARLTMWMVYGLLSLITTDDDELDDLLPRIEKDNYEPYTADYRQAIRDFIQEAKCKDLELTKDDFPLTMLSTKDKWKWKNINWYASTNGFDVDYINDILDLWATKDDKLSVLYKIKDAFIEHERHKDDLDLPF